MELRDALRGTGSVRDFTEEPVDDATVAAVLDDARFAPSGGNRQGWRVAVVHDRATRRQLGALMQPVWDDYVHQSGLGITPFSVDEDRLAAADRTSPVRHRNGLVDDIEGVPVVLAVAVDLSMLATADRLLPRQSIVGGASIYPFCWSILLAARSRGLGGVLTTFLSRAEPAAAPLLALPPGHALAATVFLGHPVHQPTRLKRRPVSDFATIDRFDGAPLAAPLAGPPAGPAGSPGSGG